MQSPTCFHNWQRKRAPLSIPPLLLSTMLQVCQDIRFFWHFSPLTGKTKTFPTGFFPPLLPREGPVFWFLFRSLKETPIGGGPFLSFFIQQAPWFDKTPPFRRCFSWPPPFPPCPFRVPILEPSETLSQFFRRLLYWMLPGSSPFPRFHQRHYYSFFLSLDHSPPPFLHFCGNLVS